MVLHQKAAADADSAVQNNNSKGRSPALCIPVNSHDATGASSIEAPMSDAAENVEGALFRQGGQESSPLNDEHPTQQVRFAEHNTERIDSRSSVVDHRNGDAQMSEAELSEAELLVSFARRMSHNNQNRGNFRGQSMAQSHLNIDSVLLPADDLSNYGAPIADLTGDNNLL